MDIQALLHMQVAGVTVQNILIAAAGTLVPIIFGLVLPRRRTVQYGMWINRTLGMALLQKRNAKAASQGIIHIILANIQWTFQDMSFGVYIDARQDLTPEEKQQKIEEYLSTIHPN